MMRAWLLLVITAALALSPAAQAQIGPPAAPTEGAAGGSPTATELAQFQPGVNPLGRGFGLLPSESTRLALYCADLFADSPNERVIFTAPPCDATVTLASDREVALSDALGAGLLTVRGRGPRDQGPRTTGQWFDVVVTNTTDQILNVSIPTATLFVPAGQPAPEISPGTKRLFAAAQARGLLGSDTLADAVWATRGFTRADVEQTALAPLDAGAARRVQELLVAADLGYDFGRGSSDYARLYEQRREGLEHASVVKGTALLPNGRIAGASVVADAAGHALVKLAPAQDSTSLYYAGRVVARHGERLEIELLHLKTGRPLQAAPRPVTVKVAAE